MPTFSAVHGGSHALWAQRVTTRSLSRISPGTWSCPRCGRRDRQGRCARLSVPRRRAAADSGHIRRPEGHSCPGTSRCADRRPGLLASLVSWSWNLVSWSWNPAFEIARWTGAPLWNRTVDLLLTMPTSLVRRRRAGPDWCRSARYRRLSASRSVCRCPKLLSLGLSLIKTGHDPQNAGQRRDSATAGSAP